MKKVVIITGSSRGIGKSIAEKFSKGDYMVYINSNRSEREGKVIAKKFKNISYIRADVSKESEVLRLFKTVMRKEKRIDILVNSAGIYKKTDKNKHPMDIKDYDKFHHVNSYGVYLCSKLIDQFMKKGHIINISSIYALNPNPNSIIASAVKSEVLSYTISFAKKYLGKINVNSIAPGYCNTDLVRKNFAKDEIKKIKQKKLIEPEEIANLVCYLTSTDTITGQIIAIDYGFLLQ